MNIIVLNLFSLSHSIQIQFEMEYQVISYYIFQMVLSLSLPKKSSSLSGKINHHRSWKEIISLSLSLSLPTVLLTPFISISSFKMLYNHQMCNYHYFYWLGKKVFFWNWNMKYISNKNVIMIFFHCIESEIV